MDMEIRKGSRHQKVIGDFGENLICNWLSRSGFEVVLVDHIAASGRNQTTMLQRASSYCTMCNALDSANAAWKANESKSARVGDFYDIPSFRGGGYQDKGKAVQLLAACAGV